MLEGNKQLSVNIVILLGFALSLVFLLNIPLNKNPVQLLGEKEVNIFLPVYLKIPSINVDSTVEYVGLTSDGAMDIPKGPQGVAWYMLGPKPGETGSAVLAGHSGWKNNIPAVFDDLHKLRIGDKIFIEDEKGVTTTFVVREIRKYNPNADAKDVFFSDDGKAHLNLITCTGIWNKIDKSRSDRLVVFTEKE